MSIYSSVAFGLEYLYQSAMEYLNRTYHQHTSDLQDIPMSEADLAEQAYYASLAADTAENYFRAQAQQAAASRGYNRASIREAHAPYYQVEPSEHGARNHGPLNGLTDYSSASLYDLYDSDNYDSSIPLGKLVL